MKVFLFFFKVCVEEEWPFSADCTVPSNLHILKLNFEDAEDFLVT